MKESVETLSVTDMIPGIEQPELSLEQIQALEWSDDELENLKLCAPYNYGWDGGWWEKPTPEQQVALDKLGAEFCERAWSYVPLCSPIARLERGAITLQEAQDPPVRKNLYEVLKGNVVRAAQDTTDPNIAAHLLDAEIDLMHEFGIPLGFRDNPFKVYWGTFGAACAGNPELADLYTAFGKRFHELQLELKPELKRGSVWKDCLSIIGDINATRHSTPRPVPVNLQPFVLGNILDTYSVAWSLDNGAYPQTVGEITRVDDCYGTRGVRAATTLVRTAHMVKKILNSEETPDELAALVTDTCHRYGNHHGFSEQRAEAFRENVYPIMRSGDVRFAKGYQQWAMSVGEFGATDFLIHAHTSEWNPTNIRDLLMALQEFPTTDWSRVRQNRKDGFSLIGVGLRDFVHDERPGVHELVSTAVTFYDLSKNASADPAEVAITQKRLEELIAASSADGYGEYHGQGKLLDLSTYDQASLNVQQHGDDQEETIIEVLRHLEVNTRPVDIVPPKTGSSELNDHLEAYYKDTSSEKLRTLTDYAHGFVADNIAAKNVGIKPEIIKALLWIDRVQTKYLRTLEKQNQGAILTDPTVASIVKFIAITTEASYDKHTVAAVVDVMTDVNVPANERKKAYLGYLLEAVNQTAKRYRANGKERWIGGLWSGNAIDALVMLNHPHFH